MGANLQPLRPGQAHMGEAVLQGYLAIWPPNNIRWPTYEAYLRLEHEIAFTRDSPIWRRLKDLGL